MAFRLASCVVHTCRPHIGLLRAPLGVCHLTQTMGLRSAEARDHGAIHPWHTAPNVPSPAEAADNILYNMPVAEESAVQRQIISILVEDQPGVLSRVSGILSSRGHNINSLSVCGTEIRGLSRMTVDFETEDSAKENTIRRIEGVEEVLAVLTVTRDRMVEREVALLKMSTEPPPGLQDAVKRLQARHDKRQALMSLAELFDGKILDIGDSHATICLTSWSKRIDAFIEIARPYTIIEVARSGVVAIPRSRVRSVQLAARVDDVVDLSLLPPS